MIKWGQPIKSAKKPSTPQPKKAKNPEQNSVYFVGKEELEEYDPNADTLLNVLSKGMYKRK